MPGRRHRFLRDSQLVQQHYRCLGRTDGKGRDDLLDRRFCWTIAMDQPQGRNRLERKRRFVVGRRTLGKFGTSHHAPSPLHRY